MFANVRAASVSACTPPQVLGKVCALTEGERLREAGWMAARLWHWLCGGCFPFSAFVLIKK